MAIASTKQLKPKTCNWCKGEYTPQRRMQAVCGLPCAIDQSRHKQHIAEQKKADRAHRERKAAAQPKAFHVKQAQTEFNKYIRLRDEVRCLPCVSCGRDHGGQWHASHYRSTAAQPALRFNELNVWRSCMPCNAHKSGNVVEYRIELIKRIGPQLVDWLEIDHKLPRAWTIEELKAIRAYYRNAQKLLQQSTER